MAEKTAIEHSHDDSHDHDHSHADEHDHEEHNHDHEEHDHDHEGGFFRRLFGGVVHSHSHGDESTMSYLEESERGIWALKISLVGLVATATFQVVIAIISSSAGLLADTIHNFADALTTFPLWIAFVVGRRQANHRYTYGFGRAEDLAGLFVVLMIFISAIIAFYESLEKLLNPQPISNVWWVIAAAIVGFLGNEGVAVFRIRIGKEIGSAALVADGQHARIDGLTSLAVVFGAIGVLMGYPQADPIVGLLITIAILLILKDTATTMYRRIMDAIDPELLDKVEKETRTVPGVLGVESVRGRWIGHRLFTDLQILVDGRISTIDSHNIAEEVRHHLWHQMPRLADISVHVDPVDPAELSREPYHTNSAHHNDSTLQRDKRKEVS